MAQIRVITWVLEFQNSTYIMKWSKFKNIAVVIQKTTNSTIHGPASSPMMWSPRWLFNGPAPKSPPNHRVHRWAIRTYHSGRSTRAFLLHTSLRSTSKVWATKAQQNWLINVATNIQLLACKASWDKLYLYAKLALRVAPYFQVLALLKSL
jgi:hypothetical protein